MNHSIDIIYLREIMSILQNLCSLEPQSSWKPFILSSELLYLIQLCDNVGEISGALLSLQNLSRRKMKAINEDIHDECGTKSIWQNVLDGTVIIKK